MKKYLFLCLGILLATLVYLNIPQVSPGTYVYVHHENEIHGWAVLCLFEDSTFELWPSGIHSGVYAGTYEVKGKQLILYDSVAKNVTYNYYFTAVNGDLKFDGEKSTALYSIRDGFIFEKINEKELQQCR